MSLIKCKDCGQEVSDKAVACVKCGFPLNDMEEAYKKQTSLWQVVAKAKTPINVFALAMMACASVLGFSATNIEDCYSLTAFTYSIHAFIAVSGMFFLAILFCRKGVYHPEDLSKVKPEVLKGLGKDRPVVAALLICTMILVYGYYQKGNNNACSGVSAKEQVSIKSRTVSLNYHPYFNK